MRVQMRNYKTIVHDMNDFWQVELIKNDKPFIWMKLSKWEYPTKDDAMNYLEDIYESEKDIPVRDIFEKNRMPQMPYRMMTDGTDRKVKKSKPRLKKKISKIKSKIKRKN